MLSLIFSSAIPLLDIQQPTIGFTICHVLFPFLHGWLLHYFQNALFAVFHYHLHYITMMLNQVISNIPPCFQDPPIFIPSFDPFLQIGSFIAIQDSNVNKKPNPTIIVLILHPTDHNSSIFHYMV